MRVGGIRAVVRSSNVVTAFALLVFAATTPLYAQTSGKLSQPMLPTYGYSRVSPAAFENTKLAAEIADLRPAQTTEDYHSCGKGVSCKCFCGNCRGPLGVRGWLHGWAATWNGKLELGLNGATGNTNNSTLFFGFDGKREYRGGDLTFDLDYFYQKANSAVTMDRAVANCRYEEEIDASSISWFLQGFFERDDLRGYFGRLSVTAGLSELLLQTDRLQLTGRAGAGVSKKIDAPNDRWRRELQIGIDYEYHLTERQRFLGFLDYYLDVSDFDTIRLNYTLAWEALLEEEWGLAMRASLMNWYDSNPGPGTTANDLYYVLSLIWGY